jgi:hypothetical protein
MYGLRSRMKKEKLLKNYKRLMREATAFSVYNEHESSRLQRQANLVLDQIEQLD